MSMGVSYFGISLYRDFDIVLWLLSKGDSSCEGAAQCYFVGILQFVVLCDASGNDCHLDIHVFELAIDVEIGGVALHRGTEGKDDLLHPTPTDALHKALYLQVARADAINGANDSAKDMIQPTVLHGILNSHHVLHVLHHTDDMAVARRIAAYLATLVVADIVADLAVVHPPTHVDKALCQRLNPALILPKQMQGKPQSRLAANARQAVYLCNGFLK